MSTTLNPEIAALRDKVEAHGRELAEIRGCLQQMDRFVAVTTHQSIWQLIALIASLCVAIAGGLAYQTSLIDKRIEQIEKRIEQSETNLNQRIEQSERNITARFEDLKQEVRAQRK
ncbi:MAG TPA: hypothetical protein VLM38_21355 [Blastocatellia bacterium]|nr:hypothetical protein [Blastocatellia bacterium]